MTNTPQNPNHTNTAVTDKIAHKLALFGASQGIGRQVLEQALEAGHEVSALSRDATKLPEGRYGLKVIEGDIFDARAARATVKGCDAVVIALGAPALSSSTVRTEGTKNILKAMHEEGIRRVVCVSVYGAWETKAALPFFLRRVIFPLYLKKPVREHEIQEQIVQASGLDWTLIRPPTLTDGPKTSEYMHGFASEQIVDTTITISRADVADFVMKQLASDAYLRQAPGVAYAKAAKARSQLAAG